VLSGRGLCDELITRPEESYRLCCVVVCDLETPRIGAPYIYNVRLLRVKFLRMIRTTKHVACTDRNNKICCVLTAICTSLLEEASALTIVFCTKQT